MSGSDSLAGRTVPARGGLRPAPAAYPDVRGSADGLRIAIVAEHASLQFGGEAALPLHYFRVLRRRGVDAWLVTHARTRDELAALFAEDMDRIVLVPDTSMHRLVWRAGRWLPRQIQAMSTGLLLRFITQVMQKRIVRGLIRDRSVNVVHQPIPVSPKEPSLMFGLGVPVVIGPMNGGMEYPPAFRARESAWIRTTVRLGRALSHLVHMLARGKRDAAALLVANDRTRKALPRGSSANVIEFIENGVDLSVWCEPGNTGRNAPGPTRFVYVGRLVDWKAVDMLLHAFKRAAAASPMALEIIGDGPEREALHALADRLQLRQREGREGGGVHFAGWRTQRECAVLLRDADVMVLPSLWECGGAVVLEAMSMGLPVIATDWGGPADYLDPECGVLVSPSGRDELIGGLADAMAALAMAPDRRARMGAAGRRKVRAEFDWEVKVDRMIGVYNSVARSPTTRRVVAAAG